MASWVQGWDRLVWVKEISIQLKIWAKFCQSVLSVHVQSLSVILKQIFTEFCSVNFLNIRTPKKFVIITLKVEQDGVSLA